MSPEQFTKQNGYTVDLLHDGVNWWARTVLGGPDVPARFQGWRLSADARTVKDAIKRLAEKVCRAHGTIVIEKQDFLCAGCGHRKSLSAHHKVHRSKQRDDRIENLVALCQECHEKEHGRKSACLRKTHSAGT